MPVKIGASRRIFVEYINEVVNLIMWRAGGVDRGGDPSGLWSPVFEGGGRLGVENILNACRFAHDYCDEAECIRGCRFLFEPEGRKLMEGAFTLSLGVEGTEDPPAHTTN